MSTYVNNNVDDLVVEASEGVVILTPRQGARFVLDLPDATRLITVLTEALQWAAAQEMSRHHPEYHLSEPSEAGNYTVTCPCGFSARVASRDGDYALFTARRHMEDVTAYVMRGDDLWYSPTR